MKRLLLLGLTLIVFAVPSQAQKSKKKSSATEPKKKSSIKSIESVTKSCKAYEGLFTLYQDTASGKSYMLIKEDQLDKEYIYFSQVIDGVLDAGYHRGSYRGSRVFSIHRYFDRIELRLKNTGYYFDEENAISKASEANINQPIIVSQKVAGQNKDGSAFLILADEVFLRETFQQIKRTPPSGPTASKVFSVGKLSKSKSKYKGIHNYPENTDVEVEYVYENPYPKRYGSQAVTDARSVAVKFRHSLIAMPEDDFKPRYDDPRVGYFTHQVNDMTSTSPTPYRDVIHRWRLVKKDPDAALSEPVKPIVWWIENTTPKELRPVIKEGVLQWNRAFEKAGFKNAVVVKEQPDDADWDAGDIRYNVLRWTSSPYPPFGGYGPSFVNPRTGEILGADIMLEYVYLTNRLRSEKIFDQAGLSYLEYDEHTEENFDEHHCSLGLHLHQASLFGLQVMAAQGVSQGIKREFLKQSIHRLVLHEVGHTLGLNHNFMASHWHSPTEVHNKELTDKEGLTGSVMEYPSINIALNKEDQGQYFDVIPGPYDHWVIEYGYSESLEDEAAEKARLDKILARSTEDGLGFGNDADDMRSAGKGIDPRMMIYDMSSDPVAYAGDRIELVNKTMPTLKEKFTTDGQSYHELRNAFLVLTGEYGISLTVMSRQIGGVYVDRAFVGQEGGGKPLTPVPYETQKKAMKYLNKYGFSPDAFKGQNDLYNYLQIQRRGFSHFSRSEDPKIHDRVLRMQKGVLNHILHYRVLKRISDSQLYGNTYELSEFMGDLTNGIFKDDLAGKVNTFRQNLQQEYLDRLMKMFKEKSRYDHLAQSAALYEINRIERMLRTNPGSDASTKAHRQHLLYKIKKMKEA